MRSLSPHFNGLPREVASDRFCDLTLQKLESTIKLQVASNQSSETFLRSCFGLAYYPIFFQEHTVLPDFLFREHTVCAGIFLQYVVPWVWHIPRFFGLRSRRP